MHWWWHCVAGEAKTHRQTVWHQDVNLLSDTQLELVLGVS
jgi:hypothetical protein